jgi:Zn-dependent M28 family amino/carboxypeptidase
MAHYDTTAETPGADDNASGVAVMLEVAAILARASFEQTIQFIGVTLEENAFPEKHSSGTRGSQTLAKHARTHHWPIQEVIVLESVAYAGEDIVQTAPPGLPFAVPETGNFIALVGNERSGSMVADLASLIRSHEFDLPFLPVTVPGNGEVLPDTRRSDHAPFWDEGYRAVMLTDTTNFRNPHYHCASDTLDTLNLDFAARVGSIAGAYLAGVCGMLDESK